MAADQTEDHQRGTEQGASVSFGQIQLLPCENMFLQALGWFDWLLTHSPVGFSEHKCIDFTHLAMMNANIYSVYTSLHIDVTPVSLTM